MEEPCLICLSPSFSGLSTVDKEDPLKAHVYSIFVLRWMLQATRQKCERLLKETRLNPGNWFSLCSTCSGLIDKALGAHHEILKLNKKVEVIRTELKGKLTESLKKELENAWRDESGALGVRSAYQLVRECFKDRGQTRLHSKETRSTTRGKKGIIKIKAVVARLDRQRIRNAKKDGKTGAQVVTEGRQPLSEVKAEVDLHDDRDDFADDFVAEVDTESYHSFSVSSPPPTADVSHRDQNDIDHCGVLPKDIHGTAGGVKKAKVENSQGVSRRKKKGRMKISQTRLAVVRESRATLGVEAMEVESSSEECSEDVEMIEIEGKRARRKSYARKFNSRLEKLVGSETESEGDEEDAIYDPEAERKKYSTIKPKIFLCEICEAPSRSKEAYTTHLKTHADPEKVARFSCSLCKFVGFSHFKLCLHYKEVHDTLHPDDVGDDFEEYVCDKCDYVTKKKQAAQRHKKRHAVEDNIEIDGFGHRCKLCGVVENTKAKIFDHMRHTHNFWTPKIQNIKTVMCHLCDKVVNSRFFKDHIRRMHDKVKLYICNECGLGYNSKVNFDDHVARHANWGERHFKCEDCGAALTSRDTLKTHRKKFHSDKPSAKKVEPGGREYKCQHCGANFPNRNAFATHRRSVHADLFRSKCDLCGMAYMDKFQLRGHIREKHPEQCGEMNTCNDCGFRGKKPGELRTHRRNACVARDVRKYPSEQRQESSSGPGTFGEPQIKEVDHKVFQRPSELQNFN